MTLWMKQSTAATIKMGPFVDSVDGNTEEAALTISQADIRLSKNGGALAQSNNVAGATHDANGIYGVPLDTTDMNTLGTLRVYVHETGALPVWQDFMVVPANVWDSLFGADKLQVDAVELSSDATAADNAEAFFDGTGYAGTGNTIPTVTGVTNQVTANVTAVSGDSVAADNLEAACDGTTYNIGGGAVVAASVTGAVGSVTGAVGSVTGNVGGNVVGSAASVTGAVGSVTGAVGSVTAAVTVGTNNDKTGYALSAAGIQAIWDALSTALTTAGSIGKRLVDYLTGDIFARLGAPAGASISADIAAIEAQTDDIGAAGAGLTAVPWNAAWDAEVESEANDALVANNLDHLAGTATAIPAIPAGTYLDQIMDDGTAVFDRTTDSLQAIRDRGDAAWDTADVSALALEATAQSILADTGTDGVVVAAGSKTGYSLAADQSAATIGTVNSVAAGGITAASVATGAIDADALAADAVDEILDEVVEGTTTLRQALRLLLGFAAGKASGGGTTTVTFRDLADTLDRLVMTVDSSGNRTAVTRNVG